MDTDQLITEAKARFSHNSAKQYLAEKYNAKLIIAEQGGLWKADLQTISFLSSFSFDDNIVMIDTFDNPVLVNRLELVIKLKELYQQVMLDWLVEWKELETKR